MKESSKKTLVRSHVGRMGDAKPTKGTDAEKVEG